MRHMPSAAVEIKIGGAISDYMRAMARSTRIEDELARRGIKLRRQGSEQIGPCPQCGGTDRFGINTRKQCWNCRQCKRDHTGDVIGLVMWLDDCDYATAVRTLTGGMPRPIRAAPPTVAGPRDDGSMSRFALAIWDEAYAPKGTPVMKHLANRGVVLPPYCAAIRFHDYCPFGKDNDGRTIYTPAMIGLVTGIIDNKPQAIHRTALDMDGNQVEVGGDKRKSLGPIKGGAIKLTPDEDVTMALGIGIGEGIETALSLVRLPEWAGSPIWCVLHKQGIADFPLLSGIETLAVAVDHDAAGEKAARTVTERWYAHDREVLLFQANNQGDDINDVVRGR
jgi:hypothetical protein